MAKLRISLAAQRDPTSTLVTRRQFVTEMNKRFRDLKGRIRRAIIQDDILGLRNPRPVYDLAGRLTTNVVDESLLDELMAEAKAAKLAKRFDFAQSQLDMDGFMMWLKFQELDGVLEIVDGADFVGGNPQRPWTNTYIQSSYAKGRERAWKELDKQGAPGSTGSPFSAAFHSVVPVSAASILYSRTYNALRGVTDTMEGQIAEVLSRGLLEGKGPYQLASEINDRVDRIGLTRARLIARTETIRAHNVAKLDAYGEASEILGEEVLVKWVTALDERVRDRHRAWHGEVMTTKEANSRIGEPNCRCTIIGVVDEQDAPELDEPATAPTPAADTPQFKDQRRQEQYEKYVAGYEAQFDQWEKEWDEDDDGAWAVIKANPDPYGETPHRVVPWALRDHIGEEMPNVRRSLTQWQTDTNESPAHALKVVAFELESPIRGETLRQPREEFREMWEYDKERYLTDALRDEYVRYRALNQVYMKRIGVTELHLLRGTDGGTGKRIREDMEESLPLLKRDGAAIRDANLVGYTMDPGTSNSFGNHTGGVEISRRFKRHEVVVHRDLLEGMTDGFEDEDEFIVRGGEQTGIDVEKDLKLKRTKYNLNGWNLQTQQGVMYPDRELGQHWRWDTNTKSWSIEDDVEVK